MRRISTLLPNEYGDRFIPRRYTKSIDDELKSLKYEDDEDKRQDILDLPIATYWREHTMKACLNMNFSIAKREILIFNDLITKFECIKINNRLPFVTVNEPRRKENRSFDWPCIPRKRPLAFIESTHDLPGFHNFSHMNIIDWSKRGKMAASFGLDLVMWSPNCELTIVYKLNGIIALAFNSEGDYLAMATYRFNKLCLEIWIMSGGGMRNKYRIPNCAPARIRCIAWSPKNTFVLCGIKTGDIYVYANNTRSKYLELCKHNTEITSIQYSCRGTYFATSDISGKVMVFFSDSFKSCSEVISPVRSPAFITWHPWTNSDLIIANHKPARIQLLSICSKELAAYYIRSDKKCRIDAVSFCKLTGELVVSCVLASGRNFIMVMASMDGIVDILCGHEYGVNFLLWSPDGRQLATAGNDETLNIWNFLPIDKYTKMSKNLNEKKYNPFSLSKSFLNSR